MQPCPHLENAAAATSTVLQLHPSQLQPAQYRCHFEDLRQQTRDQRLAARVAHVNEIMRIGATGRTDAEIRTNLMNYFEQLIEPWLVPDMDSEVDTDNNHDGNGAGTDEDSDDGEYWESGGIHYWSTADWQQHWYLGQDGNWHVWHEDEHVGLIHGRQATFSEIARRSWCAIPL